MPAKGKGSFLDRTTPDETTRHCPCGDSFSWTGFDDRLDPWMKKHRVHTGDKGKKIKEVC